MEEENARRLAARNAPRPDPAAPKEGLTAEERFADDFEFWAATCVKIKDKLSGRLVPFVLNRAQRRVLSLLERQRRGGEPIRLI
ncbi:MAG: terminase, partial [Muribaculaceae bacterium]|nr:terminase [Muribaculaceae bacterium]